MIRERQKSWDGIGRAVVVWVLGAALMAGLLWSLSGIIATVAAYWPNWRDAGNIKFSFSEVVFNDLLKVALWLFALLLVPVVQGLIRDGSGGRFVKVVTERRGWVRLAAVLSARAVLLTGVVLCVGPMLGSIGDAWLGWGQYGGRRDMTISTVFLWPGAQWGISCALVALCVGGLFALPSLWRDSKEEGR